MRRGAVLAVAAAVVIIAAIVVLPRLASPGELAASPSASASPTTSLTPTSPSASPTTALTPTPSATAASGRFVNTAMGYSIELSAPWRRAGCLSLRQDPARPDIVGVDGFTSVPAADEQYGDTGGPRGTVSVRLEPNPGRLTADAWARSPQRPPAQSIEPATLDGRPGVRALDQFGTETTFVAIDDLMYGVELTAESASDPKVGALRAIVTSFAFVPRVVTPSARPPRSAEAVADGLADAFARKDAAALASLMGECVISGAEQAGFGASSPERFTQIMRDAFAAGSTVVVRPRPIESAPGYGAGASVSVATTWTDRGRAPARVDLIIGAEGAFNYWRGMVRRQQPPP